MKTVFKLLIIFCVLTSVAYAQSFMNITAAPDDSFKAVLVEKSGKWLHILQVSEGDVKVLKSFQVMTGRVDGDKVSQGDEKTPEGLYFVTGFLSPAKLKEMYGDMGKQYGAGAYPLSYPNLKDRLDGKTGGGIWLHGVDPAREENVTKGCVAFDNDNLKMIGDFITIGTPVVITDEGMQGGVKEIREHFNKVRQIIFDYVSAWEGNDFETFKSFYADGFKSVGGRSAASYMNNKKNLMALFPYRKVFAEHFRIFSQSEKEAVAEFDQYYCAPNVSSYGTKRFYMEGEPDALKIVAEEFSPKDGSNFIRASVSNMLLLWKDAWEKRDIERYISFYSDKFLTKGMDRSAWKKDKSGKFEALSSVKVNIENISYSASSPVSYTVEFRQKYSGDEYSDVGVKTLKLEGCPGDFKIIAEYWRAE